MRRIIKFAPGHESSGFREDARKVKLKDMQKIKLLRSFMSSLQWFTFECALFLLYRHHRSKQVAYIAIMEHKIYLFVTRDFVKICAWSKYRFFSCAALSLSLPFSMWSESSRSIQLLCQGQSKKFIVSKKHTRGYKKLHKWW